MSTSEPWVVVPYTRLASATKAAVARYAPSLVWTGRDDLAYWDTLCQLWASGTDVILVEHDVVPAPSAIEDLWSCPHDWCAFPYRCGSIVVTALGCTKFSAALRARNPDAISRIQHREWFNLDSQIVYTLHQHGEAEHVHGPPVRHVKYDGELATRRNQLTRLLYVGDGRRYLNGIPAADFETDDPETIAICLESALYIEALQPKASKRNTVRAEDGLPTVSDSVDQTSS